MTEFDYNDWPLLYAAVKEQGERWQQIAEQADQNGEQFTLLKAAKHVDQYAELLDKITIMANQQFPTVDDQNNGYADYVDWCAINGITPKPEKKWTKEKAP